MPQDHVMISLKGSLPGGEVWSINPRFATPLGGVVPGIDGLLQWATNIRSGITSLVGQQLTNLMSASAAITSVRATFFSQGGELGRWQEVALATPLAGNGSQTSPTTTALVASLYTSLQGRSYRGRLFWPALRLTLDQNTGRLTQGQLPTVAAEFSAMFAAIESAAPAEYQGELVVVSKTKNTRTPVNAVRVGDVPDSQRRRKDAYVEAYATVAYPTP